MTEELTSPEAIREQLIEKRDNHLDIQTISCKPSIDAVVFSIGALIIKAMLFIETREHERLSKRLDGIEERIVSRLRGIEERIVTEIRGKARTYPIDILSRDYDKERRGKQGTQEEKQLDRPTIEKCPQMSICGPCAMGNCTGGISCYEPHTCLCQECHEGRIGEGD